MTDLPQRGLDFLLLTNSDGTGKTWGVDSTGQFTTRVHYKDAAALTANSATPSVSSGNIFYTANTKSTKITNLTDGTQGQEVFILIADTNTTFGFTSNDLMKGNGGADWTGIEYDFVRCTYITRWYCSVHESSP